MLCTFPRQYYPQFALAVKPFIKTNKNILPLRESSANSEIRKGLIMTDSRGFSDVFSFLCYIYWLGWNDLLLLNLVIQQFSFQHIPQKLSRNIVKIQEIASKSTVGALCKFL